MLDYLLSRTGPLEGEKAFLQDLIHEDVSNLRASSSVLRDSSLLSAISADPLYRERLRGGCDVIILDPFPTLRSWRQPFSQIPQWLMDVRVDGNNQIEITWRDARKKRCNANHRTGVVVRYCRRHSGPSSPFRVCRNHIFTTRPGGMLSDFDNDRVSFMTELVEIIMGQRHICDNICNACYLKLRERPSETCTHRTEMAEISSDRSWCCLGCVQSYAQALSGKAKAEGIDNLKQGCIICHFKDPAMPRWAGEWWWLNRHGFQPEPVLWCSFCSLPFHMPNQCPQSEEICQCEWHKFARAERNHQREQEETPGPSSSS